MRRGDLGSKLPQKEPVVHPEVSMNPAVRKYTERLTHKKAAPPVAGGPSPGIPLLTQEHEVGKTMAEQVPRPAVSPASFPVNPNSILTPPVAKAGFAPPNIQPTDLLPPSAKEDPGFIQGQGAMYAHMQPNLAYKYGVVRNGRVVSPQELRSGTQPAGTSKQLKPESAAGLQALLEFNETRMKAESPEAHVEAEAAKGPSAAAARINDNPKPLSPEEKSKFVEATKGYDDYDFNVLKELMTKDILNNEEQRKAIEDSCAPLDLTDLIMQGFVTQVVPVKPGIFEPEFQSMSGEVSLALKRILMEEAAQLKAPDQYYLDKYSFMTVAAGVHAINKRPLPGILDEEGHFDETLFWKRFNWLMKLPLDMIASLGLNYHWFEIRVRKLFAAETVKNG